VDLPEGLRLTIEDRPSPADCDALGYALDSYNREFLGETGFSQIGLFVRDRDDAIVAGLAGSTYAGWLFVADLWVRGELRRRGVGRELLVLAEQLAIERGCHSARLDTFSFQAPNYYPRFGYRPFAALDYPPQHRRYFLWKPLLAAAAGNAVKLFPVSVKGVLFEHGRVVLLENERGEWELPGGRLEPGETPAACLAREFAEEIGVGVSVETILDSWVYEVLPQREVLILAYGVRRGGNTALSLSGEHRQLGLFAPGELADLAMADGYRRSVRAWAARCGIVPPAAG
jgi:8-oxo-dGTP pyrophosphatase MutT (NUDIX family)/GNAT superfamily N-acetyltransferase